MWYLQVVNSSKTCSLLHLPLLCADLIETASNKQKDMVCIFILYIQTPQFRICFTAAIHQECLAHIKSSSWTLAALHATFLSIKNQRWSQNTLNYMHLTICMHGSFAKNQNWPVETSLAICQTWSDIFNCSKSNLRRFKYQPLESK